MVWKHLKRLDRRLYEKTGLHGYDHDFNVDFHAIPTGTIPHIHKYLMV